MPIEIPNPSIRPATTASPTLMACIIVLLIGMTVMVTDNGRLPFEDRLSTDIRPETIPFLTETPLPMYIRTKSTIPPRWLIKSMTRLHVMLHRLTGGHLFNSFGGEEVCFVTMKGAKSGRTLTIPLMYIPYRAGVLLVASQAGAPRNPVWYFNLLKHPEIKLSHRGSSMNLRARVASADEKPPLWPICYKHYAPYAEYRKRTNRDIPIFVCEPVS